jgi:hypothetical protein
MDENRRIEAFEANRSRIGGGGGQGAVREAHITIVAAFDLDDNRRAAADASEKSRQRNDPLIAIFIGQGLLLARVIDAAFARIKRSRVKSWNTTASPSVY